jgi:hypothetical protein
MSLSIFGAPAEAQTRTVGFEDRSDIQFHHGSVNYLVALPDQAGDERHQEQRHHNRRRDHPIRHRTNITTVSFRYLFKRHLVYDAKSVQIFSHL